MFYIPVGLYREHVKKNFLFETSRPRALVFGMRHHLVDFYRVCSNYIPGAIFSPQGSNVLHRLI